MGLKRLMLLSCAATGTFVGLTGAALAQDSVGIGEVVVTAEKREQSIQDVPVAVSAYTAERRELLGVTAVEDLARQTPSVSYTNNDRMSIRGAGRLTNAIGTDPAVALYSDGIFSNSMADAATPPLFIARTELLRGPQGTLYGRNSIGGAMNIIQRRPSDEFEAEIRGFVGNGMWGRVETRVSGPVTDFLRYSVGYVHEQREDGFIRNDGPSEDIGELNRHLYDAQIEADIGDSIVARVTFRSAEWTDTYGVGNTLVGYFSPHDRLSRSNVQAALYYNPVFGYAGPENPQANDVYRMDTNFTPRGQLSQHDRWGADITWDAGPFTVKYLGGYQDYVYDTGSDYDQTPRTGVFLMPTQTTVLVGGLPTVVNYNAAVYPDVRGFYQEDQAWSSHEINISSNGDGPFSWIVGAFTYAQDYDQEIGFRTPDDPGMAAPLGAAPNPNRNVLRYAGHLEVESRAAFAQGELQIAEGLTFSLGARYTEDEKEGFDTARLVARTEGTTAGVATSLAALGLAPNAALAVPTASNASADVTSTVLAVCNGCFANPGGGLRRNVAGDWDAITGNAGLQWEPNNDTNLYLRYSRGYKSGGFFGGSGLANEFRADPEYMNAYEAGAKITLGSTAQINSAVFFNDYIGFQAPVRVALGGGVFGTAFRNLDAEAFGIEVEALWAPIENLELGLAYAYLNTEITDGALVSDTARNGAPVVPIAGNPLPQSPENKIVLQGNYTWHLDAGSVTAGTVYSWVDTQQSTIFDTRDYRAPAFALWDLRMLYRDNDDRFTVIGYVKNALNEEGFGSVTGGVYNASLGISPSSGTLLPPRTYGVELQFRF